VWKPRLVEGLFGDLTCGAKEMSLEKEAKTLAEILFPDDPKEYEEYKKDTVKWVRLVDHQKIINDLEIKLQIRTDEWEARNRCALRRGAKIQRLEAQLNFLERQLRHMKFQNGCPMCLVNLALKEQALRKEAQE
jgi:hypothetical protein